MSTAAVIGLGIFAWVLVSILLALFVGRMIQLRDRQGTERQGTERSQPVERSATGRAGAPPPSGPEPRDKP